MKFDYVIGNPPYQEDDGGAQASARPIYQYFVEEAKRMEPGHISFIMPARWYSGGKGLDNFRDTMLNDEHIQTLHDYPITSDCFPGQNIRGGLCIFIWDSEYDNRENLVKVVNHIDGNPVVTQRSLKFEDIDIFIRYERAIDILKKVMSISNNEVIAKYVSSRKPFGLSTDFTKSNDYKTTKEELIDPVKCYSKGMKVGYIERNNILVHADWIDCYKVFTPRANNIGTELNDDNLNTFVVGANTVCTESYISIGADLGLDESAAINMSEYLQTNFARFLHGIAKSSQDATSKTYRFIPMQDFTRKISDIELYRKYDLTQEEIDFIESHVKEMV